MGTRHLIAVYIDGQYKVANYGQWDGYPEGQGLDTLNFLKNTMNEELFAEKCRKTRFITNEEYRALEMRYGADAAGFMAINDALRLSKDFPELSRDTGADILKLVQKRDPGIVLDNAITFAADGTFCEWAWVIDLDKRTFEGYKGLNKEPLNESDRFFFLEGQTSENGYHPCKLVASWSLDNLPTKKDFLAAFGVDED